LSPIPAVVRGGAVPRRHGAPLWRCARQARWFAANRADIGFVEAVPSRVVGFGRMRCLRRELGVIREASIAADPHLIAIVDPSGSWVCAGPPDWPSTHSWRRHFKRGPLRNPFCSVQLSFRAGLGLVETASWRKTGSVRSSSRSRLTRRGRQITQPSSAIQPRRSRLSVARNTPPFGAAADDRSGLEAVSGTAVICNWLIGLCAHGGAGAGAIYRQRIETTRNVRRAPIAGSAWFGAEDAPLVAHCCASNVRNYRSQNVLATFCRPSSTVMHADPAVPAIFPAALGLPIATFGFAPFYHQPVRICDGGVRRICCL